MKPNDSDEKSKDSEDKFDKNYDPNGPASDEDTNDTNMDVDDESQGESELKVKNNE